VFLLDRKFRFGRGRAFALYVMAYTAGRAWIEYLRIDQANHFIGLRVNDWVAIVVFLGALIYFVRVKGEQLILTPVAEPDGSAADSDVSTDDESDETRPAAGEAGDADADDEAADDTDAPTPRAHDDDPSAGGGTTPSASAAKK
jgi:hypothetical protein